VACHEPHRTNTHAQTHTHTQTRAREHAHANNQTHKHTNTQTHKHTHMKLRHGDHEAVVRELHVRPARPAPRASAAATGLRCEPPPRQTLSGARARGGPGGNPRPWRAKSSELTISCGPRSHDMPTSRVRRAPTARASASASARLAGTRRSAPRATRTRRIPHRYQPALPSQRIRNKRLFVVSRRGRGGGRT